MTVVGFKKRPSLLYLFHFGYDRNAAQCPVNYKMENNKITTFSRILTENQKFGGYQKT